MTLGSLTFFHSAAFIASVLLSHKFSITHVNTASDKILKIITNVCKLFDSSYIILTSIVGIKQKVRKQLGEERSFCFIICLFLITHYDIGGAKAGAQAGQDPRGEA